VVEEKIEEDVIDYIRNGALLISLLVSVRTILSQILPLAENLLIPLRQYGNQGSQDVNVQHTVPRQKPKPKFILMYTRKPGRKFDRVVVSCASTGTSIGTIARAPHDTRVPKAAIDVVPLLGRVRPTLPARKRATSPSNPPGGLK
jgi:hypothetical protein